MKFNKKLICVSILAGTLAACGGGGGGSTPTPESAAPVEEAAVARVVEGRVVDGPLSGAKVFFDTDGDLIQDDNEPSVATDADGFFELSLATAASGQTLKLVSIGGTDTSTGKVLPDMALVSDVPASGKVVVTPLSTIVAAATTPEDKKSVLVSLGIGGTVEEALAKDVWALAESGDEEAIKMQTANQAISAVLQSATSLIDTSDESSAAENATNVIAALSAQIVTQAAAGADLFDKTVLATVLEEGVEAYAAVSEPDLVIATEVFAAVADSVATVVVVIEGAGNPTSADAISVATTIQNTLQTAVEEVATSGDAAAFETASSTTTLFADADASVTAIVALDTDGDGIINTEDPDIDNDGYANAVDKLPLDRNEYADTDEDGIGNNADLDDDGDGFDDAVDAYPLDATKNVDASGSSIIGLSLPKAVKLLETEE